MDRSLAAPVGAVAVVLGLIFGPTLHSVPEGHVAVYWRGGAMTSAVAPPGFHLKMPLITSVGIVQTSLQTDVITEIPCGTHGGTVVEFARVEVVNRLRLSHVYPTIKAYVRPGSPRPRRPSPPTQRSQQINKTALPVCFSTVFCRINCGIDFS